eukprot:m.187501 g.187501  ORF g.187501 m.187501 type:complete len:397 (+) comp14775_c0_seq2:1151-2341(+)
MSEMPSKGTVSDNQAPSTTPHAHSSARTPKRKATPAKSRRQSPSSPRLASTEAKVWEQGATVRSTHNSTHTVPLHTGPRPFAMAGPSFPYFATGAPTATTVVSAAHLSALNPAQMMASQMCRLQGYFPMQVPQLAGSAIGGYPSATPYMGLQSFSHPSPALFPSAMPVWQPGTFPSQPMMDTQIGFANPYMPTHFASGNTNTNDVAFPITSPLPAKSSVVFPSQHPGATTTCNGKAEGSASSTSRSATRRRKKMHQYSHAPKPSAQESVPGTKDKVVLPQYRVSLPFTSEMEECIVKEVRTVDGVEKASFRCAKCNKTSTTASNMRRHVRSHYNVTPYSCRLCQRAFTNSRNRNVHEKQHLVNPQKYPFEPNERQVSLLREFHFGGAGGEARHALV